ncbi:MAG: hypothetical protein PHD21_01595 [Flavobacteriales bacterium]|nr:hypothetical protein [Flavobacteriales bacterium]
MINFFSSKVYKNKTYEWENKGCPKNFILDNCSSLSVIFDASNVDSVILFNYFIDFIKEKKYSISCICEESNYNISLCKNMDLIQYTKKDFSILNVPKNKDIIDFTERKKDIFIDLSLNSKKNTIRIRKSAHATLKIGVNIQEDTFDFCFNIIQKDEKIPKSVFEQIWNLLGKINK